DLETLADLSGMTEEAVVDRIDSAVVAGLIEIDERGRIALAHDLIKDTVYDGISPLRRGRMHWHALDLLERRETEQSLDEADIHMMAHHAVCGATRTTAARALSHVRAAARKFDGCGLRAEAATQWRAAVRLHELDGHTAAAADRADRLALLDALCALTDALAYDGRTAAALATRQRAVELAEELGDPEPLFAALTCWRAPVIWGVRDYRGFGAALRPTLETALSQADSRETRVRLLIALVFESGTEDVYEHACRALDLARGGDDPESVCAALNAVAYVISGPASLDGWRP
ncbi:hypothetical protein ACW9HQ_39135, partial [Nocardia gipuzkoensis]